MGPGAAGSKDNGAEVQVQEDCHKYCKDTVARPVQHDEETVSMASNTKCLILIYFVVMVTKCPFCACCTRRQISSLPCVSGTNQLKQASKNVDEKESVGV